ncbi:MAG: flagellar biosynthesis regulator FlaF [Parvularculaceae bacterium]
MSHEAYRKTSAAVAGPRDVEYRAFSEATRRLIAASETGRKDLRALIEAIHLNRTLWGTLAADCAKGANTLPTETRARIIALSRWVSDYSSDVVRKGESLDPLVDVNRIIMNGLSPAPTGA